MMGLAIQGNDCNGISNALPQGMADTEDTIVEEDEDIKATHEDIEHDKIDPRELA